MKFFELKKGQAFWFSDETERSNFNLFKCAGVDGMYGRYVSSYVDHTDPDEWMYGSPTDEVTPE